MRRDKAGFIGKRNRSHGVLTLVALLVLALLLSGCPKKPVHKKLPSGARQPPPKEMKEPMTAPEAVVGPERQASDRLLTKGRAILEQGDYERAASAFSDAVNVDTTNGAAYYYLALARARQGETDVALGILDKAEALLAHDEDWTARIDELRKELGSGGSHEVVPSPLDQSF